MDTHRIIAWLLEVGDGKLWKEANDDDDDDAAAEE